MRNDAFKSYLFDLLTAANDPRIAKVERYDADGQPNIRVVGVDGVTIELSITNSSPPGGAAMEERNIVKEGATPRPSVPIDPGWQHPTVRSGDARK